MRQRFYSATLIILSYLAKQHITSKLNRDNKHDRADLINVIEDSRG